jgi:hypothetical protein
MPAITGTSPGVARNYTWHHTLLGCLLALVVTLASKQARIRRKLSRAARQAAAG